MHTPNIIILVICLLSTLQTPSMARLGETILECNARYGNPEKVNVAEESLLKLHEQTHLFNGYRVLIYFIDGVSVHENFIRIQKEEDGTRVISPSDQESILSANTKSKFRRINESKYIDGVFEWIDDSEARAFQSTAFASDGAVPSLTLSIKKYIEYNQKFFNDLQKKKHEEKADKFLQERKEAVERLKRF